MMGQFQKMEKQKSHAKKSRKYSATPTPVPGERGIQSHNLKESQAALVTGSPSYRRTHSSLKH
jgi:hypothetical protein